MRYQCLKKFMLIFFTFIGVQLIACQLSSSVSAKEKIKYTPVNPNKYQRINLAFKDRNDNDLEKFIYQTVTPGNPNYRKYLTPNEFGVKYGPSDQYIKTVSDYMKSHHLKVYTYPGKLVMNVSGKTKDINKAFNVELLQYSNKKENYLEQKYRNNKMKLPDNISKNIIFIQGLKDLYDLKNVDYATQNSNFKRKYPFNGWTPYFNSDGTSFSYKNLTEHYNGKNIYNNGNGGQNQTIGIIAMDDYSKSDAINYYKGSLVDYNPNKLHKIYLNPVNSGGGQMYEYIMDNELSSSIAPKANVNTYIGHNELEDYATAIARDNVSVISASFGIGESFVKQYGHNNGVAPKAINLLFKQAAAQGISNFASTGDTGAYTIFGDTLTLQTQFPADSPYITSVGGTMVPQTLSLSTMFNNLYSEKDQTVTMKQEHSWTSDLEHQLFGADVINRINDKGWTDYIIKEAKKKGKTLTEKQIQAKLKSDNLSNLEAGGGGFSKIFAIPEYQKETSGAGTFNAKNIINLDNGDLNPDAALITGTAPGRNVPDISGNAETGGNYPMYANGEWMGTGGTSSITPSYAAIAAVINSKQGQRMGFWNPQIYRFARSDKSPFTPINSLYDDNLYYTGQPGKLYNQSTGLGIPNLDQLAQSFADQK